MSQPVRYIEQNLLDVHCEPLAVTTVFEDELDNGIAAFLGPALSATTNSPSAISVGLSGGYSKAGTLTALAASVQTRVLVIRFRAQSKAGDSAVVAARQLLENKVLCHPRVVLYAFDLAPLALALYCDHSLCIGNGVDVQSACTCDDQRNPANATQFAISSTHVSKMFRGNVEDIFATCAYNPDKLATSRGLALRSWLAGYLPSCGDMEERCREVPRINTKSTDAEQLMVLGQFAKTGQQQETMKPGHTVHDFSAVSANQNKFKFNQERFETRLRAHNGPVQMTMKDRHGGQFVVEARTRDIAGRNGILKASASVQGKSILSIASVDNGKTMAEQQRSATILSVLQGTSPLFENPFLKTIWPDDKKANWPEETYPTSDIIPPLTYQHPLNNSQLKAVEHMLSLSNSYRITIIQGPPGTGKTTVIGAFVQTAVDAGASGIWLLAQSNVAVKNIAEKLAKIGFLDWRLLVSKDFHLGWHEHLYHQLSRNVIRSDDLRKAARELKGVKVILSTLSMLANPRIDIVISKIPINTMVVDEASQIAVSDYIYPLNTFKSLQKLCFIGDDKQLPPYGQDEIAELQSIFEIPHLHKGVMFLDTQYRMPPQIGKIISATVYDKKLKSNPDHDVKSDACFFVDVDQGAEKQHKTSWENLMECQVVVKIAAKLQEEDANYRIITPYEAQRTLIENSLKEADISWANKCFNVDSFQGNEDDYIIISVVRSKELGFLKDLRRTNVMLTRCKKGMFICSSWNFLVEGKGLASLVGQMAAACKDEAWLSMDDIDTGNF